MSTLAIYSRVSTDDQKVYGHSLQDQVYRGQEASKQYGYDKIEIFQDAGLSGSLGFDKRPQLNSLINQITSGNIQGLFVTDIDRLSRDHMQTQIIKSLLKDNNVRLYDVNGEIKLNDVNAELLADMRSLLAAYEIKKTSGRIKRVLESNARNGKIHGGLPTYGYTKDYEKKMIPDPNESKVVKQIFEMAMEGKGTKVIAETLNEMGIPTKRANLGKSMKYGKNGQKEKQPHEFKWRDAVVYKILTNTVYKGERVHNDKVYSVPSIIKPEVFDAVQEMIKERKRFMKTTDRWFYLLKGLVVCKRCGSTLHGRTREDRSDHQYTCTSGRYRKEYCGNRGVNIDHLENLVWDNLIQLDKDILKFYEWYSSNNVIKMQEQFLIDLDRQKEEMSKRITNLLRLGADGSIPDEFFKVEMKKLNDENEHIRTRVEEVKKSLRTMEEKEKVISIIKDYVKEAKRNDLTNDEKSTICRSLIEKVEVEWTGEKHDIYIQYKIDRLSQFKLSTLNNIEYRKSGFSLRKSRVFQSHIIIQRNLTPFPDLNLGELPPFVYILAQHHPGVASLLAPDVPQVFVDTPPNEIVSKHRPEPRPLTDEEWDDLGVFPKGSQRHGKNPNSKDKTKRK